MLHIFGYKALEGHRFFVFVWGVFVLPIFHKLRSEDELKIEIKFIRTLFQSFGFNSIGKMVRVNLIFIPQLKWQYLTRCFHCG